MKKFPAVETYRSAILTLFLLTQAAAQTPSPSPADTSATAIQTERFTGRLDAQLAPDLVHIYQRVLNSRPVRPAFSPGIDKKAVVSAGEVYDQRIPAGKTEMFLVEPPTGSAFVAVDLNANRTIELAERFQLQPSPNDPNDLDATLRLPITGPHYKTFPIFVRYKRGFKHAKLLATDRLILQSIMAVAYGTVDLRGRPVRFQYPFTVERPWISTTDGVFGIDTDGDGRIRDEQFSPESSYATKDELVFRIGDLYLSTAAIDLLKNQITVSIRSKEQYRRHEIAVGQTMPEFSFVDFEGKTRSLSDFKNSYLLIDFWGVWCVDCRLETPFHVDAMKRFRSRGFDILSLNTDERMETAVQYMQENKLTWTQARNDSIRSLIEVTYRIQEYPSTILLGPGAKVLVLDQRLLRGDRLLQTLEQELPK